MRRRIDWDWIIFEVGATAVMVIMVSVLVITCGILGVLIYRNYFSPCAIPKNQPVPATVYGREYIPERDKWQSIMVGKTPMMRLVHYPEEWRLIVRTNGRRIVAAVTSWVYDAVEIGDNVTVVCLGGKRYRADVGEMDADTTD